MHINTRTTFMPVISECQVHSDTVESFLARVSADLFRAWICLLRRGNLWECVSQGSLFSRGREGGRSSKALPLQKPDVWNIKRCRCHNIWQRPWGTAHSLLAACHYCSGRTLQIGLYHTCRAERKWFCCVRIQP